MARVITIDDPSRISDRDLGRRTDPLRSIPIGDPGEWQARRQKRSTNGPDQDGSGRSAARSSSQLAATTRQRAQLPTFAPLLEELEIAGWSANRGRLSGNFHDWMLLGSDRVLVAAGHAVGPEPLDPVEAALVAQSVWTAVRAHAHDSTDAGALLSLASRTLWPLPAAAVRACVAVALLDTVGGQAHVALAGDCLAWRVRAAACEPLALHQPLLGGAADFMYSGHSFPLMLRERLILIADDGAHRGAKFANSIALGFSSLDAESHRRMTAADALAVARQTIDSRRDEEANTSASVIAVRRR